MDKHHRGGGPGASGTPGAVALAIHGGAGDPVGVDPDEERARRAVLREALDQGLARLHAGETALVACIAAVEILEDCPLFNAGRGAVLDAEGGVSFDASVMWGADRSAGAVGGLTRVCHPVQAAELIRRETPHVQLTGPAALALALEHGLACAAPDWFRTAARRAQLAQLGRGEVALDHSGGTAPPGQPTGTVGAVARDRQGHLAAATSTGGMAGKWPGRIGDSAVIGAGTWAHDATCAISATGHGERFIEAHVAARIADWIELGGLSLPAAAARVVHEELAGFGAGGVIAVDATGQLSAPFNTRGMYRALAHADGRIEVGGF